jgi:hypothetical protein
MCQAGALPLEPCLQRFFALVILETGCHFLPKPAYTWILQFYISHHSWDDRPVLLSCPDLFYIEIESCEFFLTWTGLESQSP